jgi:hypothetical protein
MPIPALLTNPHDRSLQQIVDVMNEMDLWRDALVVFTEVHGLERR